MTFSADTVASGRVREREMVSWARELKGIRISKIIRIGRRYGYDNLIFMGLIFCKVRDKKQIINSENDKSFHIFSHFWEKIGLGGYMGMMIYFS